MDRIKDELNQLRVSGNYRVIPAGNSDVKLIDFSSNDYLGLAADCNLQSEFFAQPGIIELPLTSSASRLLANRQQEYGKLEDKLRQLYRKDALLFNSGYHANTGLVQCLADKNTLIAADKLVHASIIDGCKLSAATTMRFRHNDINHLERILRSKASQFKRIIIIAESVYSMDGDYAPIDDLVTIKQQFNQSLLYIDEAHGFGVCGERGLGLVEESGHSTDVDVLVGTFGKAAASQGAFAVMDTELHDYAVNRARSFIFSTAIPPLNAAWTLFVLERLPLMKERRIKLRNLSSLLVENLGLEMKPSHIIPFIIGDACTTTAISHKLILEGLKVLPIRTPTVPPGTERLRISLSAAMTPADIQRLSSALNDIRNQITTG